MSLLLSEDKSSSKNDFKIGEEAQDDCEASASYYTLVLLNQVVITCISGSIA